MAFKREGCVAGLKGHARAPESDTEGEEEEEEEEARCERIHAVAWTSQFKLEP